MQPIAWKCICMGVAATCLSGCGNGPADPITQSTVETSTSNFMAADFVSRSSLKVKALKGESLEDGQDLVLPAGTQVSVIETKVHPQYGTIVRLGVDVEEGEGIPSDFWVPLDQALLEGLVRLEDSESLVETEETLSLLHEARKKMTYCFRYVKRYLLSTGQVDTYLPGVSAYMAAKILPQHGFSKTGNTPQTAKEGEVCVYAGGPNGHGHIEVKRNGKWWYGYGFLDQPIKGRKFLACFTKA